MTLPTGPPPLTRMVREASSSFISSPSMDAPQSVLPSAAEAVGDRPCISRARSTVALALMADIFTRPSLVTALTISSILSYSPLTAVKKTRSPPPIGPSVRVLMSTNPACLSSEATASGSWAYSMCSSDARCQARPLR